MMTAQQKLKHLILIRGLKFGGNEVAEPVTDENIDALYDAACEDDETCDNMQDARSEVRSGSEKTGLQCEYSRHYESYAVAAKASDGSWIGWTYWYGGGKHAEPEAIGWIEDAYDVTCAEEEKLVVVRTFMKDVPPASA